MAISTLRSAYRDELNAARLRIDTLEEELEAKRAGEACDGRALEEAKAKARESETRARECETRAREFEARVRELERAASERSRRAAERASARRPGQPQPSTALAPVDAPMRAQELAWVALGLVNLGALAVLASLHVGATASLAAVVVGAAASHGFFARLAGRSFGWHERDEWPPRGTKPSPAPPLPPGRLVKLHAAPPPRAYSTTAPTLVNGLGPRTRLRAKRGRDLARGRTQPERAPL